jgi:hypothetical protein
MLSAVDFDDHSLFQTDKVNDVVFQRLLATEFETVNLPDP